MFPACTICKRQFSTDLELIWYLKVILMLFKVASRSLNLMLASSSDVCAPLLCSVFLPAVFFKPWSPLLFTFCNLTVSIFCTYLFCSSLISLSSSLLHNIRCHVSLIFPGQPRSTLWQLLLSSFLILHSTLSVVDVSVLLNQLTMVAYIEKFVFWLFASHTISVSPYNPLLSVPHLY